MILVVLNKQCFNKNTNNDELPIWPDLFTYMHNINNQSSPMKSSMFGMHACATIFLIFSFSKFCFNTPTCMW